MIKKHIVHTLKKNTKLNNNQNKQKKQSPQKRSVKVMPPQAKNTFLQMQKVL